MPARYLRHPLQQSGSGLFSDFFDVQPYGAAVGHAWDTLADTDFFGDVIAAKHADNLAPDAGTFTDDFTRANGNIGGGWGAQVQTTHALPQVSGNQLVGNGSNASAVYNTITTANGAPEIEIISAPASGSFHRFVIYFRIINPNSGTVSGYELDVQQESGVSKWEFIKITNSVRSNMGSASNPGLLANGNKIRPVISGNSFIGQRWNGSAWVNEHTDSDSLNSYPNGGYVGVGFENGGTGTLDNIVITGLPTATPNPQTDRAFAVASVVTGGSAIAAVAQSKDSDAAAAVARAVNSAPAQSRDSDAVAVIARVALAGVAQSRDTDQATAIGRSVARATAETRDTDTAAVIASQVQAGAKAQSSDTDAAAAVARQVYRALAQTNDKDAAAAVGRAVFAAVAQSRDSDAAQAIGRAVARAVAVSSERDTVAAVARLAQGAVAQSRETDQAAAVAVAVAPGAVAQSRDSDKSAAVAHVVYAAAISARDSDSAAAVGRVICVAKASSQDGNAALAVAALVTVVRAMSSERDSAFAVAAFTVDVDLGLAIPHPGRTGAGARSPAAVGARQSVSAGVRSRPRVGVR